MARHNKLQIQVIARAASILRALEKEKAGLSLGELAKSVGLPRSTVQRIVAALHSEKLLVPASPAGGVRLGPTVLALASSMRTDFVAFARPYIERLSSELRETVDLSAIRNDHLVFLDQIVGPQRLRTVSAVGEKFPLHCTANGKAYLAHLEDVAAERLLGRQLARLTPHTLTSWSSLREDLKKVRKRGIAYDREEHSVGICAAGACLRDFAGNYVAISVPVPTHRFKISEMRITELLLATKAALDECVSAAAA
jgi:IclR family transcriptional regulator, acetate operon repressor